MEEIVFCRDLHPDIETGRNRIEQKVLIEIPEKGVNGSTGLIVFINGFNTDAESDYQRKVLKPYLANKYNCVVMDTNYFGLRRVTDVSPTESLVNNFNMIYSDNMKISDANSMDVVFTHIIGRLVSINCNSLDTRCQFVLTGKKGEYESWGYIPAIDILNYTGMLIRKYKLNCKRLILYGMSYGGYVAKLIGKLAPHTFSVIIDKAGFSRVKMKHVLGHELIKADYSNSYPDISGKRVLISNYYDNPWTIMKKDSPCYFSDAHRMIRSLLVEKHRIPSDTRYYAFHSVPDDIAPIEDCDMEMDILKKYNKVHYERVDAGMIGKSIFKSDRHDLSVSTRGLFDYVAGLDGGSLEKESVNNDFMLQSRHCFDCGDREYIFQYSNNYQLRVEINKK